MKRSVGIVCLTVIGGVPHAILQTRGKFNTEKMGPESFPGCLQVTCHGGLKEGETFYDGLIREAGEELGKTFTDWCQVDVPLTKLVVVMNDEKEVITFGAIIPNDLIKLIRLGPDTGGLDLVTKEMADAIVPISKDMKINGPPPGIRAMFPDEIEAVKKAFEILMKTSVPEDDRPIKLSGLMPG